MPRADPVAVLLVAVALVAAQAPPAGAADAERGRQLYELHCGGCHYERVHERDRWRSKIESQADLRAEVARWARQTKHTFTADDIADVAEYLDRSHYRLKR